MIGPIPFSTEELISIRDILNIPEMRQEISESEMKSLRRAISYTITNCTDDQTRLVAEISLLI